MKTLQQGGPPTLVHRCFVAYGKAVIATFAVTTGIFSLSATAAPDKLSDYAQVYVDQYFEPEEHLQLTEESLRKSRALAYFAYGRTLEAKGRTPEAVEAYKQVLDNQPDQYFLARKTAYLLARSGQQDEALDLLEENLEKNPDEPMAYIALSEYLATYQANDSEARGRSFEVIEEAMEKFPDEPAVYDHLIKIYLVANRKEEAREVLAEAARRKNEDPEYWLALGKIAGRVWPVRPGGDITDAELINVLFAKALEFAGSDWRVVENVADFYHATSQFQRAADAYDKVIAANPDRLDVREKLARVYGGLGNEEKVIEILKEIVQIDPQNVRTLKQISGIYLQQGLYKEAIPYFKASLEVTKGSQEEYTALAQMMLEAGENQLAADFLEESSYLFPESPGFPFLASVALARVEAWKESLPFFEQTIELAKEAQPQLLNEQFYFQFAAANERAGDLVKAEELFRKALDMLAENDPEGQETRFAATIYNYIGYMWIENDIKIDEAGELIKTAADLDPESGAIADSLGWYEFKKGNYDAAREELLRAERSIEKPDPVIYDHIGQVFFALGESETAVEYMEKAVEMDPENDDLKKRLESYRNEKAPKPDDTPEPKETSGKSEKAEPLAAQ